MKIRFLFCDEKKEARRLTFEPIASCFSLIKTFMNEDLFFSNLNRWWIRNVMWEWVQVVYACFYDACPTTRLSVVDDTFVGFLATLFTAFISSEFHDKLSMVEQSFHSLLYYVIVIWYAWASTQRASADAYGACSGVLMPVRSSMTPKSDENKSRGKIFHQNVRENCSRARMKNPRFP